MSDMQKMRSEIAQSLSDDIHVRFLRDTEDDELLPLAAEYQDKIDAAPDKASLENNITKKTQQLLVLEPQRLSPDEKQKLFPEDIHSTMSKVGEKLAELSSPGERGLEQRQKILEYAVNNTNAYDNPSYRSDYHEHMEMNNEEETFDLLFAKNVKKLETKFSQHDNPLSNELSRFQKTVPFPAPEQKQALQKYIKDNNLPDIVSLNIEYHDDVQVKDMVELMMRRDHLDDSLLTTMQYGAKKVNGIYPVSTPLVSEERTAGNAAAHSEDENNASEHKPGQGRGVKRLRSVIDQNRDNNVSEQPPASSALLSPGSPQLQDRSATENANAASSSNSAILSNSERGEQENSLQEPDSKRGRYDDRDRSSDRGR